MKIASVYKIIHIQSDIVYVGSTMSRELKHRWKSHKNRKNGTSIQPYFEEFGIENFRIIKIKEYKVVDNKHLRAYEQLWMNKLQCVNKQGSITFLKPKHKSMIWREENKIEIKKYKKE